MMISDNSVLDRLVEKLGTQTVVQARLGLPNAQTINWWRRRGIAWGMRVKVHQLCVALKLAVPEGWITTPPKGEPAGKNGKPGRPAKPAVKSRAKPKRANRSKPRRRAVRVGHAARAAL